MSTTTALVPGVDRRLDPLLERLPSLAIVDAHTHMELPFGGTKRSGHGREKGLLALEEVSTTKTLVHYHG